MFSRALFGMHNILRQLILRFSTLLPAPLFEHFAGASTLMRGISEVLDQQWQTQAESQASVAK